MKFYYTIFYFVCLAPLTLFAQIDLPESFQEGFEFCDYFDGSTGPSDVYIDKEGIYINLNESGKIVKLDSTFGISTISTNTAEQLINIVTGQSVTIPAIANTRYQYIDENSSKLIVKNELDLIGAIGEERHHPNFYIIDISNNFQIGKRIYLEFDSIHFVPQDVIYSKKEESYFIYSTIGNPAFNDPPTSDLDHLVIYNDSNNEFISIPINLGPVEFFENQKSDVFFFANNSLHSLDKNLNYEEIIDSLQVEKTYLYGEDEMLLLTSDGIDIYDNSFSELRHSIELDGYYPNIPMTTFGKKIYIYAVGKLIVIDENFEVQILFDLPPNGLQVRGVFNNGDLTYLWGRINGTATYIKAVDANTDTLPCFTTIPIDECAEIELIDFEPILMTCDTNIWYEGNNGAYSYHYNIYVDAILKVKNNNDFDITNLKMELKNTNFIEGFFMHTSYINSGTINIATNTEKDIIVSFLLRTKPEATFALINDINEAFEDLDNPLYIELTQLNELDCSNYILELEVSTLLPYYEGDCGQLVANKYTEKLINKIYINPNPVSQILHVKSLSSNISFHILNLDGKSQIRGQLRNNVDNIDVSNLEQGLYFIKFSDNTIQKFYKN